ncbi:MAG: hypothetical protein ABJN84_18200 [Flavobacteriaceae bacterium]
MTNISERLNSLEDHKLMDVVKNYRQYGYSNEIRNEALSILENRGVDEFDLRLKGSLQNSTYDQAIGYYHDFERNSKIAFGLYLYMIFGNVLVTVLLPDWESIDLILSIVSIAVLIGYLLFILLSFVNQSNFYRAIEKTYGAEGALVYFLVGMPFYIFMYFYFRKQMKEQLNLVS